MRTNFKLINSLDILEDALPTDETDMSIIINATNIARRRGRPRKQRIDWSAITLSTERIQAVVIEAILEWSAKQHKKAS